MAAALILDLVERILSKSEYLRFGFKFEAERLEHSLQTIRGVLVDFEDWQQQRNPAVEDWMRQLRDVLYETDDLVDELAIESMRQRAEQSSIVEKVRGFFHNLAFHPTMAHKMRDMREKIDSVVSDWTSYRYMLPVAESREKERLPAPSHSLLEFDVIGREEDTRAIIDLLIDSGDEEFVSVIPILGMGGIGKTTLARQVYNDVRVTTHFKFKIWVHVSNDFEVGALARKIIHAATGEEFSNLDLDHVVVRFREILGGKKYLLVLDDVWNENLERWLPLRGLLMYGARRSKIIVTTRSEVVARLMGTVLPYHLGGLPESDAWSLFKELAFRPQQEEMVPHLELIGKEIVKKCDGVPLAVRTLAGVLSLKDTERDWWAVYESELATPGPVATDILSVLKISYDHLPFHLKQCFAYCSIFPEDFRIEKDTLVKLWVAQGYIYSPHSDRLLEDIGDVYFQDLCCRSFFQDIEKDKYANVVSCKMHKLIRDLAKAVAGDEFFIWDNETQNISERILHLSTNWELCFSQKLTTLLRARNLRTLFVHSTDRQHSMSSIDEICSSLRRLRVLGLRNTGIKTLPYSIGRMKHLRYIDVSESRYMTYLPRSITMLQNLQTLKLSKCSGLEELPEDIGKLINLRHLEIDECDELTHMPRSLGQLTFLQTLPIFVLGKNSFTSSGLNELKSLNHLSGKLRIKNLNNIRNVSEAKEANLMGKLNLVALELEWNWAGYDREENYIALLEGLQPHPNLKELRIKGYQSGSFPRWMWDPLQLPNLVEISIEDCFQCQHLPPFGQLTLKVLNIKGCNQLRSLSPEMGQLTALNTLQIEDCQMLDLSDEKGLLSLESLCSLRISHLPKLVVLPEWLRKSTSLQDLSISNCDNLESFPKWLGHLSSLQLRISSCRRIGDSAMRVGTSVHASAEHFPQSAII